MLSLSTSSADAAKRLGVSRAVTDRVVAEYDFDESVFIENKKKIILTDRTGLSKNRDTNLRNFILNNELIEYVCSVPECGQGPTWMGKKLTLDLEHINGNPQDNRLENLTFLCKNCHSQTSTYGNKRGGKVEHETVRISDHGGPMTV